MTNTYRNKFGEEQVREWRGQTTTILKEAITKDCLTILWIERVSDGLEVCFNVRLIHNDKTIGLSSFHSFYEALNKWYDLIEDGIRFNGYRFERREDIALPENS